MPVHLNIRVADLERSKRFYRHWLRFEAGERWFADGTVFLRDAEGTDLALHPGDPGPIPASFHFGFRRADPGQVRRLRDGMAAEGVDIRGFDDEPGIVSVKFTDPDGYLVEVYWEPDDVADLPGS